MNDVVPRVIVALTLHIPTVFVSICRSAHCGVPIVWMQCNAVCTLFVFQFHTWLQYIQYHTVACAKESSKVCFVIVDVISSSRFVELSTSEIGLYVVCALWIFGNPYTSEMATPMVWCLILVIPARYRNVKMNHWMRAFPYECSAGCFRQKAVFTVIHFQLLVKIYKFCNWVNLSE